MVHALHAIGPMSRLACKGIPFRTWHMHTHALAIHCCLQDGPGAEEEEQPAGGHQPGACGWQGMCGLLRQHLHFLCCRLDESMWRCCLPALLHLGHPAYADT